MNIQEAPDIFEAFLFKLFKTLHDYFTAMNAHLNLLSPLPF